MFFRLNAFAFLIDGKEYSIYDVKTDRIFILDNDVGDILRHLESNKEIEEYEKYLEKKEKYKSILNKMCEMGIGDFYKNKVHIEKFRYRSEIEQEGILEPVPQYTKCYLEISNMCDTGCSFCGKSVYKNWLNCQSCFVSQSHQAVDIDYNSLIMELEEIGCKELNIRGGEPFLNKTAIESILNICKRNSKLTVAITTLGNAELGEMIKTINLYSKIHINLNVFSIGRLKNIGSTWMKKLAKKQEDMIDALRTKNISFSVTLQLCKDNRLFAKELYDEIKQLLGININVADIVNINEKEVLTHIRNNQKLLPSYVNQREFYLRKQFNRCLYGGFAIDLYGNVKICPGINYVIGNLMNGDLHDILGNEKLYEYWRFTKDKVPYCKECSMRYYCADCSIFELEAIDNSSLQSVYCPANINDTHISLHSVEFTNRIVEHIFIDNV